MAINYNFNDPALQGLLGAAGPIMDTPRQAAVMPMTQQAVAPDYLSMLAGLDLSGLGGFGGGRMGGVIQDPNIEYITAPISNKGNPTGKMGGNVFAVTPNQPVRLVDLNTKTVIFEGTGADAAREATRLGQSITDEKGRKASYDIQTADPSGTYVTVANEKRNKSVLGKIADVALPIAAGFIPGVGPVLGAALGSAASSVAQGRSLENTLLRAGLSAGGSALGGQLFGQVAPGASAPMTGINADLIPNALQGLNFGSLASASIPAAVGGAAGDILVNAARNAASNAIGSAAGSAAGSVAAQIGAPNQSNVVDGVDQDTGDIVVSKYRPLSPSGGFDPIAATAAVAFPTGSILDSLGPLNPPPADPALMEPQVATPQLPLEGAIVPTLGPLVAPPSTPPTAPGNGGVLGTGLNIPQLLSIGGVGADLLKSLLAGGGDTGTGVPYVSPFGTGVGFAPGRDMRVNPNILDYERYGFGPEAMFFRPEYSGLVSGAAPAQAPQAMTINPAYQPLI